MRAIDVFHVPRFTSMQWKRSRANGNEQNTSMCDAGVCVSAGMNMLNKQRNTLLYCVERDDTTDEREMNLSKYWFKNKTDDKLFSCKLIADFGIFFLFFFFVFNDPNKLKRQRTAEEKKWGKRSHHFPNLSGCMEEWNALEYKQIFFRDYVGALEAHQLINSCYIEWIEWNTCELVSGVANNTKYLLYNGSKQYLRSTHSNKQPCEARQDKATQQYICYTSSRQA